ncbi:MAG: HD domain-containing protein [Candidatus Riflebacteria bacterium]|nr:HD domain-containing protein [Candidatus Riflebacteria bacterium]
MKEELLKLIPEFQEIKNPELREKTVAAFMLAMEKGGWKAEDLSKIPFTLLIKDTTISFLEHTRAVTRICIGMADAMTPIFKDRLPIDRDILISGGILHDVGKLLEYKRDGKGYGKSESGKLLRHPFSGVQIATLAGLPDSISHIIANHSHEGDHGKRTTEGILLHHADFTTFEPVKP